MELSAEARRRFARHLLLSEVGAEGQAKLCRTRFAVRSGSETVAAETARTYLERAGMREAGPGQAADVEVRLPSPSELMRWAGTTELQAAAAMFAGAHAAVEAIKEALELGPSNPLPEGAIFGPVP